MKHEFKFFFGLIMLLIIFSFNSVFGEDSQNRVFKDVTITNIPESLAPARLAYPSGEDNYRVFFKSNIALEPGKIQFSCVAVCDGNSCTIKLSSGDCQGYQDGDLNEQEYSFIIPSKEEQRSSSLDCVGTAKCNNPPPVNNQPTNPDYRPPERTPQTVLPGCDTYQPEDCPTDRCQVEESTSNIGGGCTFAKSVPVRRCVYAEPEEPDCSDGKDNDNDGYIDSQDLGCYEETAWGNGVKLAYHANRDSEANVEHQCGLMSMPTDMPGGIFASALPSAEQQCTSQPTSQPTTQCNDDKDNDKDGFNNAEDIGCYKRANMQSEGNVVRWTLEYDSKLNNEADKFNCQLIEEAKKHTPPDVVNVPAGLDVIKQCSQQPPSPEPECTENKHCDDGNLCTEDKCVNYQCQSTNLPNDYYCMTGNGGTSRCRDGKCLCSNSGSPCPKNTACIEYKCEGESLTKRGQCVAKKKSGTCKFKIGGKEQTGTCDSKGICQPTDCTTNGCEDTKSECVKNICDTGKCIAQYYDGNECNNKKGLCKEGQCVPKDKYG